MFDLCEFFMETNMQLISQLVYTLLFGRQPSLFQIISVIKGILCVHFKLTSISLSYSLWNASQQSIFKTIVRVLWVVCLNLQLGYFIHNDFQDIIGSSSDLNKYIVAIYIIVCFCVCVTCKIYCSQSTNTKMRCFMLSGMCIYGVVTHTLLMVGEFEKGSFSSIFYYALFVYVHFEFVFFFGYAAFCVSAVGNIWKWDDISPNNVFLKVVLFCQNMFFGFGTFLWTCYWFYLILDDLASYT